MPEPIIFVDVSEILPGKLDEVKVAFEELAAFVDANEPRVISYDVFLDASETLVTVIQVHHDSASMEFHMKAGAELFKRFTNLLTMRSMQIYGRPSRALLEAMQSKATMLGAGRVEINNRHASLSRPR